MDHKEAWRPGGRDGGQEAEGLWKRLSQLLLFLLGGWTDWISAVNPLLLTDSDSAVLDLEFMFADFHSGVVYSAPQIFYFFATPQVLRVVFFFY